MKKEILQPVTVAEKDIQLLEMHSFLNLINILTGTMQTIRILMDRTGLFSGSLAALWAMCADLRDRVKILEHLRKAEAYAEIFRKEIVEAAAARAVYGLLNEKTEELAGIMEEILPVFLVRSAEMLERSGLPQNAWVEVPTGRLEGNLRDVFNAVGRNGMGRYSVVFDRKKADGNSYVVQIAIRGLRDGLIRLPPVMQDVLRDMTANARKYSPPGSVIDCRMEETAEGLSLSVADNGRGIPSSEIEKVVLWGYRGSNTTADETRGAGFGLTKAYYYCRKFGGRMWIDSEQGRGTEVSIFIPKPEKAE